MKTRFWVILFFAALLSVTANADNVFRLLRKGDTFQVGDRIIIVDTTAHKAIAQLETQGLVVGVDLGEVHDSISLADDSPIAVFTLEHCQSGYYLRNKKELYLNVINKNTLHLTRYPSDINTSQVFLSDSSVYLVAAQSFLCWNSFKNCFNYSKTLSPLCIYRCTCPEITIDGENVNADNSSILSKYKNQYVNLTVKRKFVENGGYYTLTLPFFLTSRDADYYFGGNKLCKIDFTDANNIITIYFANTKKEMWPTDAGSPYVLNWTKGNVEQITFRGVCIESPTPNTIVSKNMNEGVFKCVGIYDPTDIYTPSKVTRYLGSANGTTMLKTPKSGSGKLKGLRAYFVYPSSASVVKVSSQGVADGITRIDGELLQPSDDNWYSLQGMRLSGRPSLPGLYIHHGRKYIVR